MGDFVEGFWLQRGDKYLCVYEYAASQRQHRSPLLNPDYIGSHTDSPQQSKRLDYIT